MIVDTVRGNVLEAPYKHIAFAVNTEGLNDAGFAGALSYYCWPELSETGPKKLGETISRNHNGKTFHALVCHSLSDDGWKETANVVADCLDSLKVSDDEIIAIIFIGTGLVGQLVGADAFSILGGMARSKKKVVVYTL